jgi:phospholipase C
MTQTARLARAAVLAFAGAAGAAQLSDVKHFVLIYQENWSFDGLLGKFPGADGLDSASMESKTQLDSTGTPYAHLPWVDTVHFGHLDTLANGPWDMTRYLDADSETNDLVHRYYQQQWQINGGKNNRYAAGSDAKGLSMSYVDASNLPLGMLGKEGVVFDRFFHSAFGGSFLNHQWLIAAHTPRWGSATAPYSKITRFDTAGNRLNDGYLTPDSFAVNTVQPWTQPYSPGTADSLRLPLLDDTTIADRLDSAHVSWAWYAGGWDSAMAGKGNSPMVQFQYHHQAFNYYRKFSDTAGDYRKSHLKDEHTFFSDLSAGTLPSVVWIKPEGEENEHPGYTTLVRGQNHVKSIVDSLKNHPSIWDSTVVLITYDENGGRWDHVAPPTLDKWGPGARVPTVLLSPLARHGFVDKRTYETVSSLSFIEKRWNLRPLSHRDSVADPLSGAFEFSMSGIRGRQPVRHHRLSLMSLPGGDLKVERTETNGVQDVEVRDLKGELVGSARMEPGRSSARIAVGAHRGVLVVRGQDQEPALAIAR